MGDARPEPAAPRADGGPSRQRPCVVHLVRAANGPEPLRAFASALRAHAAGVDYELVLAMKGFGSADAARPYVAELTDVEPTVLYFTDEGFDLGVYFAAAARLGRDRYCFLNSFSMPIADGWLARLDAAIAQPGVGLVGATGSWSSTISWMAYSLGLPSAYRGVLPPPSTVRRELLALIPAQAARGRRSTREALAARLLALRLLPHEQTFPSHHIRTNAFMLSHRTLQRLRLPIVRSKFDTLLLEGGRSSLTQQILGLGLRTLVVDRTGTGFDHDRWDRSRTLYQGDQEDLLVADNRTVLYEQGDDSLRRVLSLLSWGERAAPSPAHT